MAYYPPFTQQVHYCGLYYVVPNQYQIQKQYLPQVDLQAHSTVLSTTSRTTLTQTFVNPSSTKAIHEVRYTFPLYDGVSVVGFQCHVGDRTIVGEVKEKEKARAVFKEAVAQGQTAGLFEQLPDAADVFTTTVGNIPPGARVVVRISYLGELKHDMEVDGIRFTIPNIICPRYGQLPNAFHQSADTVDAKGTGISITVDAEMADGSFIQKIQSPSHPISISMGTTSFAPNAEPKMTKASATLTLGTAELETDFVLQIIAKDTGMPKAVLETHPTLPSHRALMATLVPKFALPAEKPEIVFIIDQSGSMSGSRNKLAVQALKVFLKSLPVGVKFNICAFGSRFDYLWPSSVTYSQETLDTATKYADNLDANYGGTNILEPLQATIEKRYKDMPLEIMLLTDGEVWNQDALFQYLNQQISATQTPIRLFSLGIGNGVSHSLIEGVAKAGNGFSQVVGEGEQMDSKVVRMLKGALSPHVNDYTLEVKYSTNPEAVAGEEDDYEIVEKVADSLTVKLDLGDEKQKQKESQTVGLQSETMRSFFTDYYQKKPISLFDQSINPDQEAPPAHDETGEARYAHLPKVPVPKIIQAPQNIPSLFAFIRTNVYLLLGPNAPQSTPKSVVLRGTSNHGPLELEIPVQILETPGETIHQLAAKKAISELEQGRGWLPEAKDDSGSLIKSKFEGRFSDMVEREAVRLGVQFQVGGKWCSFVAVEKNKTGDEKMNEDYEYLDDEIPEEIPRQRKYRFEDDSEDEDDEDGDEATLETLQRSVQRLNRLSQSAGFEMSVQNQRIDRIVQKSDKVDDSSVSLQRHRLTRIPLGSNSVNTHTASTTTAPLAKRVTRKMKLCTPSLERGERLDSLQDTSNQLSVQSKLFYSKAKKQNASLLGSVGSFLGASRSKSQASAAPQAFGFGAAPSAPSASATYMPSPGPPKTGGTSLQDYQSGLMVLEQQSKKRLLMARQEQDTPVLFGAAAPPPPPAPAAFSTGGGGFGSAYGAGPGGPSPFMTNSQTNPASRRKSLKGPAPPPPPPQQQSSASLFGGFGSSTTSHGEVFRRNAPTTGSAFPQPSVKIGGDLLQFLVALQTFEGSWEWTSALFITVGVEEGRVESERGALGVEKKIFATALVIAVFEEKLGGSKGSWELVVEKAKSWLEFNAGGKSEDVDTVIDKARVLVK